MQSNMPIILVPCLWNCQFSI